MGNFSWFICIVFVRKFEKPAIDDWNPFEEFTPRFSSPRIGYQLVLNDTTFGTGFNIWYAFMPVRARYRFHETEQAGF